MKYVKLLLVFAFALLPMAGFAEKGDMWEVKDADLTVWDSPNYLTKLGMMHQGDTFEEEGMDGDMIRFLYKGKTAYVASYCCQRFEPEPDSDVDVEEEMPAAATQQDVKEDAKNEKTELTAVAQQKGKQASNADAKKEDMQAPAGTQQSAEKEETGVLNEHSVAAPITCWRRPRSYRHCVYFLLCFQIPEIGKMDEWEMWHGSDTLQTIQQVAPRSRTGGTSNCSDYHIIWISGNAGRTGQHLADIPIADRCSTYHSNPRSVSLVQI